MQIAESAFFLRLKCRVSKIAMGNKKKAPKRHLDLDKARQPTYN